MPVNDYSFTNLGNLPETLAPSNALTSPSQGETFAHGKSITISGKAAGSDGSVSRGESYADKTLIHSNSYQQSLARRWVDI